MNNDNQSNDTLPLSLKETHLVRRITAGLEGLPAEIHSGNSHTALVYKVLTPLEELLWANSAVATNQLVKCWSILLDRFNTEHLLQLATILCINAMNHEMCVREMLADEDGKCIAICTLMMECLWLENDAYLLGKRLDVHGSSVIGHPVELAKLPIPERVNLVGSHFYGAAWSAICGTHITSAMDVVNDIWKMRPPYCIRPLVATPETMVPAW